MSGEYGRALDDKAFFMREVEQIKFRTPNVSKVEVGKILYSGLQLSETYYLSPDMQRALIDAATKLPDTFFVEPSTVPSRFGYFYLPAGFKMSSFYFNTDEVVYLDEATITALVWLPAGPEQPGGYRVMALSHDKISTFLHCGSMGIAENLAISGAGVVEDVRKELTLASLSDGVSQEEIEAIAANRSFAFRLLIASWLFIQQQITVATVEHVDRATAKRAMRAGIAPEVRVIRLRRMYNSSKDVGKDDSEHHAVDWQYQWIVRGHWRNQPYPSLHTVKPIWIAPVVKGPKNKPLKPVSEKVFAVVR